MIHSMFNTKYWLYKLIKELRDNRGKTVDEILMENEDLKEWFETEERWNNLTQAERHAIVSTSDWYD